jgi:hypothetical protein
MILRWVCSLVLVSYVCGRGANLRAELKSALLNSDLMPPGLLLKQSEASRPLAVLAPLANTTVFNALNTMSYHRYNI